VPATTASATTLFAESEHIAFRATAAWSIDSGRAPAYSVCGELGIIPSSAFLGCGRAVRCYQRTRRPAPVAAVSARRWSELKRALTSHPLRAVDGSWSALHSHGVSPKNLSFASHQLKSPRMTLRIVLSSFRLALVCLSLLRFPAAAAPVDERAAPLPGDSGDTSSSLRRHLFTVPAKGASRAADQRQKSYEMFSALLEPMEDPRVTAHRLHTGGRCSSRRASGRAG